MLIKSVYDLIRAFVVAACKHLVTVVTVENQHVNHPLSIESRAVSMDRLPQNRHYCAIGSMVFSRGQRSVKGQVSRGVVVRVDTLALRDGVTCWCPFSLIR
jgi:hypothetical protein